MTVLKNIPIRKPSTGPAEDVIGLVVPGSCPAEELEIHERAYREAPAGAGQVMFKTDELDADGEPTGREIWDEVEDTRTKAQREKEPRITEAQRWRRIMGWPDGTRDPEPSDAEEFLKAVNQEAAAKDWYAIQAHRTATAGPSGSAAAPAATKVPDDPEPAPRSPPKPPGGYKLV